MSKNKVSRFCKRCIFLDCGGCNKTIECSGSSEFIMDQLPAVKDSLSLTDILWRELKEYYFSTRDLEGFSESEIKLLWQNNQLRLIHESHGN